MTKYKWLKNDGNSGLIKSYLLIKFRQITMSAFLSKQHFMELPRNRAKQKGIEENGNYWSEPKTNSLVSPDSHSAQTVSLFILLSCSFLQYVVHMVHRNVSLAFSLSIYSTTYRPVYKPKRHNNPCRHTHTRAH